jgi:hypothetical protein
MCRGVALVVQEADTLATAARGNELVPPTETIVFFSFGNALMHCILDDSCNLSKLEGMDQFHVRCAIWNLGLEVRRKWHQNFPTTSTKSSNRNLMKALKMK